MHPAMILTIGSLIMIAGVLIASVMKNWWAFVFFYCVVWPFGIGLVYWPPIMCGWEWFPNNKGLVSGLIVGGYGFGAFIFGFISTAIANPDNEKPETPKDGSTEDKLFPRSVADNVPEMFELCLYFWIALCIIAILTVRRNPEYVR